MIQSETEVRPVAFEHDKLKMSEWSWDGEDVLTSVQIRLEGQEVWVFINDYERKHHCKRIPYTEFREKLTKMIDNPKTGKPI